jgi:hypothetical protein
MARHDANGNQVAIKLLCIVRKQCSAKSPHVVVIHDGRRNLPESLKLRGQNQIGQASQGSSYAALRHEYR